LERILEQRGHGAVRVELAGLDGAAGVVIPDENIAKPRLQVFQARGQAQDRHYLRGGDDVEAVFARMAVHRAAQSYDDLAQRAVVEVYHPLPGDEPVVQIQHVAVLNVIIDHRRQQIMGQADGMEITGEVQVNVLHRHHLCVATAGRAALQAEAGSQRRLAQAHHGAGADSVERIAQAHAGGRLAFTRRRGADSGHKDQLAVVAIT
jgi:hypothetical protein